SGTSGGINLDAVDAVSGYDITGARTGPARRCSRGAAYGVVRRADDKYASGEVGKRRGAGGICAYKVAAYLRACRTRAVNHYSRGGNEDGCLPVATDHVAKSGCRAADNCVRRSVTYTPACRLPTGAVPAAFVPM